VLYLACKVGEAALATAVAVAVAAMLMAWGRIGYGQ
jgi:hypothetical protein